MARFALLIIILGFTSDVLSFKIYWNVPSSSCKQYGIMFDLEKFGIIQNTADSFTGDNIGIFYEPGRFPIFLNKSGLIEVRNGGIPQLGDLGESLNATETTVENNFRDKNFRGLGILNFETWRPLWNQNFMSNPQQAIYRLESVEVEKRRHPGWNQARLEKEAETQFNKHTRLFMEETLKIVQALRPLGLWGFYGFPSCFNYNSQHNFDCTPSAKQDNERMLWLFNASSAFFPSIYLSTLDSVKHRPVIIAARMNEARRVGRLVMNSRGSSHSSHSSDCPKVLTPVFPYIRFRYIDKEIFLSQDDLDASFGTAIGLGLQGLVIWGSSGDVNSKGRCQRLLQYVEQVLGPTTKNAVEASKLLKQTFLQPVDEKFSNLNCRIVQSL